LGCARPPSAGIFLFRILVALREANGSENITAVLEPLPNSAMMNLARLRF
jgi:hypothetical protein